MSCVYHYLPFARVLDKLFRRQVDLLRPGTVLPDSTTISRTTRYVYEQQARRVKSYFEGIDTIHLAIDGWTSPTATAYLGLVIHWHAEGRLWRAVLEFIRLERNHTGTYLAEQVAGCLERYGLKEKLLAVCLDNASTNDKLVNQLPEFIRFFRGPKSHVRCAAHIINLMVKAFTDHFSEPTTKKRKSANQPSKPQKRTRSATAPKDESNPTEDIQADPEQADDEPTGEHEVSPDDIDEARQQFDEKIIKETTAAGLEYAAKYLGLVITDAMRACARGVISKTGKLARRLHVSPTLQAKFEALIDASSQQLRTFRRALARRIATRWNLDYECLLSHKELKPCVQMLTAESANELRHLMLDENQWELLEQLIRVLKIFKEASDLFSQAEVPMVHEVVPIFIRIRQRLQLVREDKSQKLNPIIHAAAHSALLVYQKYMGLFTVSEVYWTALVMCPDMKLQWLRDQGYPPSDVEQIYAMIVARFNESYRTSQSATSPPVASRSTGDSDSEDEWLLASKPSPSNGLVLGSIESYLRTEPVSSEAIRIAGGPLKYWQSLKSSKAHSELAKFAMDYLSAPASSVDSERAFSCGRLMNNHLQHQMSPDTFCAKMAIRSWYETPLLPDVEDVAALLEGHSIQPPPLD